jgi:hypothetical protein
MCGGKGYVEFDGVYADTLQLLRMEGKEMSGADLAKIDGCKPTAMNNRLAQLEIAGFVASRRYGRKRLFRCK